MAEQQCDSAGKQSVPRLGLHGSWDQETIACSALSQPWDAEGAGRAREQNPAAATHLAQDHPILPSWGDVTFTQLNAFHPH